jgi:hypothetical protein
VGALSLEKEPHFLFLRDKREMNLAISELSDEERKAFSELLKELQEKGLFEPQKPFHSEGNLLKYLLAAKFDPEKALNWWKESLEWRKENRIDNILEEVNLSEEYRRLSPRTFHKTDKLGRPVCIANLGKTDFNVLRKVVNPEDLGKITIYELEKMWKVRFSAASKKYGRVVNQTLNILDFAGASFFQIKAAYQWLTNMAPLIQKQYPESMAKLYIINAPYVFSSLWVMAKKYLLEERVVKRIEILGSDYKNVLLEAIEQENLPSFLGGSCNCPNGCINMYDIG